MMSGMNKDIKPLRDILVKLAKQHKDRGAFNCAVEAIFPTCGCGAYRVAHDAGKYVIKLRLTESNYGQRALDACNRTERRNWKKLTPEFQFFVLEPVLVKLLNEHDAVIMQKVEVSQDARWNDDKDRFTLLMEQQLQVISRSFADTHSGNIGFDADAERVWLIDYNHGAQHENRDENDSTAAKKVIRRVTRSTKCKQKAA